MIFTLTGGFLGVCIFLVYERYNKRYTSNQKSSNSTNNMLMKGFDGTMSLIGMAMSGIVGSAAGFVIGSTLLALGFHPFTTMTIGWKH